MIIDIFLSVGVNDMFGKNKNAKLKKEVIRLNDQAVFEEEHGNTDKILPYIDKAAAMSEKIKPYQLLNWIVECNHTRYHLLYDPDVDKQYSRDTYIYLRNLAKKNVSEDQFSMIKEQYENLLIELLSLFHDGKPNELFEEILEEVTAFSQDYEAKTPRREYLQIMSSGFAASYYLNFGNYAVAIYYGTKILEQTDYEDEISNLKLFFLNQLLFTYVFSGQMTHAVDLGRFLYIKYLKNEVQIGDMDEIHRMFYGYAVALAMNGEYRLAYHIIKKAFELGIMSDLSRGAYVPNLYFLYIDLAQRCQVTVCDEIYQNAELLLEKRKHTNDFQSEYISEKSALDLISGIFAKRRKREYVEFLDRAFERYVREECPEGESVAYLSQMVMLLKEYGELKDKIRIKKCGKHMMLQIYKYIQHCQYYVDNDRILEALVNIESAFAIAYSTLVEDEPEKEKFEYILNYKNLLPTIVKYRDVQIMNNPELCDILREVNHVKDMMAQISSRVLSLASGRETMENLKCRLTELGNMFSSKYGKYNKIPYYSVDEFMKIVPKHSIVLDLFFSKLDLYMQPIVNTLELYDYDRMECFIWIYGEDLTLRYHKNENVKELLELLEEFLKTIQDPHRKYQKRTAEIYKKMFDDCIDDVDGIDTIYICPHLLDANVPFDVIFSQNPQLQNCKMVYLQTVRELFYQHESSALTDICIIGNPSYSLKDCYTDDILSGKRGMQLLPLPFSEYEAKSVAGIYNKECYIGKSAMKNCIRSGYRMFHIATHGFSQRDDMRNVWYSSALSFAGIIDWMDSGVEQGTYGNGILTADEISRMDLKGTELVVLSACNSGNSLLYSSNHLAGLHIAFAAAGVNYIISSLWEVDDFATAILMQLFAKEWNAGKTVEESLLNAKRKLRIMTVEDVYQHIIQNGAIDSIPGDMPETLRTLDQTKQIFRAPYYWAGFVCYQNMIHKE